MEQRETTLVVKPFKNILLSRGWHVENIHGNQYQDGLPDHYICHDLYSPRWIEYKVLDSGNHVHLTDAQKIKFPILVAKGVPIFIIAAHDLRGIENKNIRERLYRKLFEAPNALYALNHRTHSLLL